MQAPLGHEPLIDQIASDAITSTWRPRGQRDYGDGGTAGMAVTYGTMGPEVTWGLR